MSGDLSLVAGPFDFLPVNTVCRHAWCDPTIVSLACAEHSLEARLFRLLRVRIWTTSHSMQILAMVYFSYARNLSDC